jgi:hypothetical protein
MSSEGKIYVLPFAMNLSHSAAREYRGLRQIAK